MTYGTIVADPPWPVRWSGDPKRVGANGWNPGAMTPGKPLPYATMTVDDIAALPVGDLADREAHLFLWTFDRHLISGAAAMVARAWGFTPTNHMIVWDKGQYGMGYFPRPQHELLLIARRGKLPFQVQNVGSVQRWQIPRRAHSAKPDAALDLIEQASPGPYVELFARRARFGWDYWGDQSLGTAELTAPPAGADR